MPSITCGAQTACVGEAGPGAIFFAGVVVVTIFAAMSFDPRLIWDTQEPNYE